MTATKACRDCGKQFKRSRADKTVRCPACRKAGREPKAVEYPPGYCIVCLGEAKPGRITSRNADGVMVESACYGQAHRASA